MMRRMPDDEFRILTVWTDPEAPMLDDKEQMKWLIKYMEKQRPLLIFDTLRDFYNGDEDSAVGEIRWLAGMFQCALGFSVACAYLM